MQSGAFWCAESESDGGNCGRDDFSVKNAVSRISTFMVRSTLRGQHFSWNECGPDGGFQNHWVFLVSDTFLSLDSFRGMNFHLASTAAKISVQFWCPDLSPGPRNLGGKIGSCMLMKVEILKIKNFIQKIIPHTISAIRFGFSASKSSGLQCANQKLM